MFTQTNTASTRRSIQKPTIRVRKERIRRKLHGIARHGSTVLGALLILTMALGQPLTGWAIEPAPWTAVASTGTVDEADTGIVQFGFGSSISIISNVKHGTAHIKSSALLPAALDLRYNVVSVPGLLEPDAWGIRARLQDNGDQAQVILYLKKVDLNTGAEHTLITLDSNASPASSGFQTLATHDCQGVYFAFDFDNNAYFVHAVLTKTGAAGNPGLHAIQLVGTSCLK